MSLDPAPSDDELRRMAAERSGRRMFGMQVVADHTMPPGRVDFRQDGKTVASIVGIGEPITLRIPWSCLVSDNAKFRAAIRWYGDKPTPTIVLTAEYRRARDTIKRLAKDVMAGRPAYEQPLSLTARVWVPNKQPRDCVNFSKALHDALQHVVYTDDKWLYRVTWERAGVDVDSPRAEISIAILPP